MDDLVYSEQLVDRIYKSDQLFIEKTPFNKHIGMRVEKYGQFPLKLRFDFRDQLVGNYARKILHGGVTLSLLDTVGGMQLFREVIKRMDNESDEALARVLNRISTIDINAQFLKPGIGTSYYATAQVKRLGRRIAFVDMQMFNQDETLIATGNGIYNVA